eukprot:17369-Heterococcus_DN1.PRE.2
MPYVPGTTLLNSATAELQPNDVRQLVLIKLIQRTAAISNSNNQQQQCYQYGSNISTSSTASIINSSATSLVPYAES